MEGAARTDGRRVRGEKEESKKEKLKRIEDERQRREGLLWLVIKEDC